MLFTDQAISFTAQFQHTQLKCCFAILGPRALQVFIVMPATAQVGNVVHQPLPDANCRANIDFPALLVAYEVHASTARSINEKHHETPYVKLGKLRRLAKGGM